MPLFFSPRPGAPALTFSAVTAALLLTGQPAWAQAALPASAPASAPPQASTAFPARDVAMLAGTCANCHGPDGRSPGNIPSLRGQSPERLAERMRAFRQAFASGTADAGATVMPRLMQGYDNAQIDALAQWFAQEKAPSATLAAAPQATTSAPAQRGQP